jgi:Fur family ferric uptake transcriptional regulator
VQLPAVEVSQSPEDKFREYLASRPRPQRYTGQQRDLVRYIFSQHSHFDAEQLIKEVERAGFKASRATIYRTLNKLVDARMLRPLEMGSRTFYEHDYGYPQHDHLQCTRCNKIIEFQHPGLDDLVGEVSRQQGFQAERRSFIIRGVCADCNRARVIKRRLDLV